MLWINNKEKALPSIVELKSITLIKALSDDPILNNNQRWGRQEERRFGCLDMQLYESCSSQDKHKPLHWNHLVKFNLFSCQDTCCCTFCISNPVLLILSYIPYCGNKKRGFSDYV
ncbi:hypothetical protein XENOCAPTIV_000022 [Xenoophorus captivus]|uniref:Uncharacterized protein n=1 Tax=Xenoophorus captivus TaxID=1517983 RepID=A0ABV0R5U9_9TELE